MTDKDNNIYDELRSILFPESESFKILRDVSVVLSFFLVLAIISLIFTGMFTPFYSVSSGSMEPNLERGDLVIAVSPDRATSPSQHGDTHITPADQSGDYITFNQQGHVILFEPSNYEQTFIHRAMFWVDEGENWYDRANQDYTNANSCEQLLNCPAPNSGFITKGDANSQYDQAFGISEPVPPEDINAVAWFSVPYLGYIRLIVGLTAVVSVYNFRDILTDR